ncbi:major facilitator superfamily domain-containing protein [Hypoxylon sp. FL1284]|nr:major facilitator superfamily domain-containing protein [Hypoxylon sp. FL1284]
MTAFFQPRQSCDDAGSAMSGSRGRRKETIATFESQETAVDSQIAATATKEFDNEVVTVTLTEDACPDALATAWSSTKKWRVLTIIFLVQASMNLNASLYSNGQSGIMREFDVSSQAAVSGAAVFLVTYAFGCELWAPWSEEFGRKIILQASLTLVNVCCLPICLARSFPTIIAGRALGGLFSAGGSVTLGMVADMFVTSEQELPLAFIVLSSVGGSIIGPIIGGYIEETSHWTWTIWIQLIFGVFVQLLHLFFVPETRAAVLVAKHAKKMRKSGEIPNVYGPDELKTWKECLMPKQIISVWVRPFKMLATERIVFVLSTLSGFSDAVIFMQIQSFSRVFELWNFSTSQVGLSFIPTGIGYVLGYLLFIPVIRRNKALRAKDPANERAQYESRLWMLLYTAPCLPLGMIVFAWTSRPEVPWIIPMLSWVFIGVANYCIYLTTIDYMVATYGPYSASATGGNGFSRDMLAGLLTWAAGPYYDAFAFDNGLNIANTVWAGVGLLLTVAAYLVYFYGPSMRKKSPFAESLDCNNDSSDGEKPPQ